MVNSKPSGIIYLWYLRPSGRRTYADVDTGWWLADLAAADSSTPSRQLPAAVSQLPLMMKKYIKVSTGHCSRFVGWSLLPRPQWHPRRSTTVSPKLKIIKFNSTYLDLYLSKYDGLHFLGSHLRPGSLFACWHLLLVGTRAVS